jgi:hypothetical protein
MDVRTAAEDYILSLEPGDLGQPRAGLHREQHHDVVAAS